MRLESLLIHPLNSRPITQRERKTRLHEAFLRYGANVLIKEESEGPSTRTYIVEPKSNTSIKKMKMCLDDIALTMGVGSVDLVNTSGILKLEVPRVDRTFPTTKELLELVGGESKKLDLLIGQDTMGSPVLANLEHLPHLLIAGATGSGKSVALHSILCSLLYTHSPSDLRLILIDPKQIELTIYDGLPHLATEVVTDPGEALQVLQQLTYIMEDRYVHLFSRGSRSAHAAGLPAIVVVIDEFADFRISLGKEFELEVLRLAQKARAAGIHLIVATQRPSVKVITGDIKANFPARLALKTATSTDSRVIIGKSGTEKLLGMGDALFFHNSKVQRVQVPFAGREDVQELKRHYQQAGDTD